MNKNLLLALLVCLPYSASQAGIHSKKVNRSKTTITQTTASTPISRYGLQLGERVTTTTNIRYTGMGPNVRNQMLLSPTSTVTKLTTLGKILSTAEITTLCGVVALAGYCIYKNITTKTA